MRLALAPLVPPYFSDHTTYRLSLSCRFHFVACKVSYHRSRFAHAPLPARALSVVPLYCFSSRRGTATISQAVRRCYFAEQRGAGGPTSPDLEDEDTYDEMEQGCVCSTLGIHVVFPFLIVLETRVLLVWTSRNRVHPSAGFAGWRPVPRACCGCIPPLLLCLTICVYRVCWWWPAFLAKPFPVPVFLCCAVDDCCSFVRCTRL